MVSVSRSPASTAVRTTSDATTRSYTVKDGDTFYTLARSNGLTVDDLSRANPQVADPARIRVGQQLQIPPSAPLSLETPTLAATTSVAADAKVMTAARARAAVADASVRGRLDAQVPAAAGAVQTALTSTGTLRRSQQGPAVRELQVQLNARGASLQVDGDFGRSTQKAVRDFQRRHGVDADGIVGQDTRAAFAMTATARAPAQTTPTTSTPVTPSSPVLLRSGAKGPAVETLQQRLNSLTGAGLRVDGDFGRSTRTAVENFQRRVGLEIDGEVGPATSAAMNEVAAGTRQLAAPSATVAPAPVRPGGPRSRTITAVGNTFAVHDIQRREFGRRSVPGNRIISLDSNSASGRAGEILRPMIVIPNNATAAERRAAQASVNAVAQWLSQNNPGDGRATTGIVKTTAENGRGIGGFFHTEFHSVNDTDAVRMIRERPQEYARILAGTLGGIAGANFIVPHGNRGDTGAVAVGGNTEVSIAQGVVRNGFFGL